MRRALLASVLAVTAAGSASAQSLSGSLSDPSGAVVAGAKVTVVCGSTTFRSVADHKGLFTFKERPSYNDCTLLVVKDGFAPYQLALSGTSQVLEITLKLAMVREAVSIQASADETALDSTTLSRNDLSKVSNDPAELTAYAQQVAGAAPIPSHTYIDGLPSTNLPPAAMIESVSVNRDPFSPEYADGDENRVEVTTRSPDRKLHVGLDGSSIGLGGNSAMGPHLGSSSKWTSPVVSGPVPYSLLAFSLQANFSSTSSEQLIQAVTSSGSSSPTSEVTTAGNSNSGSLNLYYSGQQGTRAYVSLFRSDSTASNSGAGGLTLAQASSASSFQADEMRASFQSSGKNWVQRSAILLGRKASQSWANDDNVGLDVPGYFVSGGSPIQAEHSTKDQWLCKTVFQSSSKNHFWESGLVVSHATDSDQQNPNPAGQVWFANVADYNAALAGAAIGTWIGATHKGLGSYGSVIASPFAQTDIWRAAHLIIRAGVRGDYQSRAGIGLSPRASAIAQFHTFILREGVGLFVHEWPNAIFLQPLRNNMLNPFVAAGVSLPANETGTPTARNQAPIISQLAPGLDRPRTLMSKTSVDRPLGSFDAGLEFTWTNGDHLLGTRRIPNDSGWLDLLESNRDLHRSELHPRIRYVWRRQALTANYEWMHSRDDTDGPFSYAEFYNNLQAEWARTTAVPAHNASLVANLNLPRSFSLTIVSSFHSSSPYNITSGRDVDADGLFNDRGGLLRNSGNGPGYRSVSLYGSRLVSLNRLSRQHEKGGGVIIGLQVEDLLGDRNYLTVEGVEDSPLFGQPLSALPGRTLRIWFNLTQ
jgi:hypothetical protein